MEAVLDKAEALDRAKRHAAWFLVGAAALFGLSLVLKGPPVWVIELLRSMSEAAMVGGLADWFAVAALFRPVNLLGLIPIFPSHTGVIPRSKDRIASSLGDFVRDHFLKTETLVAMVKHRDPAQFVANWFLEKRNTERVGRHGAQLLSWALNGLHEEKVQALIAKTIRDAFKDLDLSRTAGEVLEAILRQGRHHELLNEAIATLLETLRDPGTRASIADELSKAIRSDYPKSQYLLPTEAIGRSVTDGGVSWIARYLENVSQQTDHEMRAAFDRKAKELVVHLKGDSEFASKGDEIKEYIIGDEKFTGYIRALWTSLREMIEQDLRHTDSEIYMKLVGAGDWIGTMLEKDEELRASLNRQVESLVEQFGPALGTFISNHIEGTIKGWDARAMSVLIEENIGTDLQKIRINGTLIGGLLGGVLFAIAYLASNPGMVH